MYNLILTLGVYSFMIVSAAVLLTIIIYRQERWITETVLSRFNNFPISIFHRDLEAEYTTHLLRPVSLAAYNALSAY